MAAHGVFGMEMIVAPDEAMSEPSVRHHESTPDPMVPVARLREAFEFALDCQLVTDGHGVILAANQAAASLLQCPKEFLPGKPLGLFVSEGQRSRFYSSLGRLWQGLPSDTFEIQVGRRSEHLRHAMITGSVRDRDSGARTISTFGWVLRDVTDLRRAEATRLDLLRRLVTAQEDERRRISRELHDSLGQLLAALSIAVKSARRAGPLPPEAETGMESVERLADQLSGAVHELTARLRPTALDDLGLEAALTQHIGDWSQRLGIEVDYQAVGVHDQRLPPEVETAMYRVIQEALTNVACHSQARLVSIVVFRHDGQATVVIEDDGVGFDPAAAAASGRLGLLGMRERVTLAGGSLDVESTPGTGTTLIARFPMAPERRLLNGGAA